MEHKLDVRGLRCPLPVLKANKALRSLAAGDTLEVLATDAAAEKDFAAFAQETGHALLVSEKSADALRFLLRKRDDD